MRPAWNKFAIAESKGHPNASEGRQNIEGDYDRAIDHRLGRLRDGERASAHAQTAMGPVLADAKGMTLYTFDKDADGKSNCNGKCAENWPPLKADGTS